MCHERTLRGLYALEGAVILLLAAGDCVAVLCCSHRINDANTPDRMSVPSNSSGNLCVAIWTLLERLSVIHVAIVC
jgi:hypothetical protein